MAYQEMNLSWLRRFIIAMSGATAGNGIASMIENGNALASQAGASEAAAIVAAHVSATTDFKALAVGDLVVHIPAVAGNAAFAAVVTAGTNPFGAAVVGDLYIAIRAFSLPPAHNYKL